MSTNINLLLHTEEESLKQKKKVRLFRFIAAASLVSIGLISLSIFILVQLINPASIKKEQEDILNRVSQFKNRQVKLMIFEDRVENIGEILKMREDVSKRTNGLLAKIPSGMSISNLEVGDTSVVIIGQSESLYTIGEFINNFTGLVRRKEIIKSLTLNSLSFSEGSNAYQISIKSDL